MGKRGFLYKREALTAKYFMKTFFRQLGYGAIVLISTGAAAAWADTAGSLAGISAGGTAEVIGPAPSATQTELRKRQEQLTLENSVAELELRKALTVMSAEKQRRELENSLTQQRAQAEIAAMQTELDKLNKQTDLLNRRLALRDAERRTRLDADLAAAREKAERLRTQNDLAAAELAAKNRELSLKEQELRVRSAELQAQKAELENQVSKLTAELELRDKREQWKNRVNAEIKYTKEPYKDGILTISDRRVKLSGVIVNRTADQIIEQINYFNNQSGEYPIFLVIDDSPGGSVVAGEKILKTMRGSRAPVYVVVKSYAASMAATIATLATRSYTYPNAIILHHQLLTTTAGNLTEQRENVRELEYWWTRLAAPVAAKMGVSLDDFVKQMYKNRSTGDWREFGDRARKLKWVDEVVEVIHEESYIKKPEPTSAAAIAALLGQRSATGGSTELIAGQAREPADELVERIDASGRPYVRLPRLSPVDAYYLYNPDNYYRLTQ